MNWYYSINGQRQGPVTQAEFERLVSTSVITEQTLVWKEGMAEWKPYANLAAGNAGGSGGAGGATTGGAAADDTAECVVSGKRFPKREMIQYEGKWVSAAHRDEFFQRLRQGMGTGDGAIPGPFGYGGFWRRFFAKFVDGIALYLITLPFDLIFSRVILGQPHSFGYQPDAENMGDFFLFTAMNMVVGISVGLAYCVFFIRRYQATPGKLALGLKVLRSDGTTLSVGRIIGRYFSEWISGMILLIGYIMAAFDDEKRALHDRIADTRVIKSR